MNVWHFYARYYNFGDHALGVGLRNLFDWYFEPHTLLFKPYDAHRVKFDKEALRRLNNEADMLLVGGGGLIHEFHGEWLFKLPDKLISKVEVPIVCYGLGYNLFPGESPISPKIVKNIQLLQEHSIHFSVRNDGSQERLAKVGINAIEVPDPGFFVDGNLLSPSSVNEPYVVVQLANDMKKHRGFSDEHLLQSMETVIRYLLQQEYEVVLAPHVRADNILCDELCKAIGTSRIHKWDWFHLMRDECVLEGLGYYKHASFVIGMRGHAQIFPIGMKIPVITIGSHAKNLGLIERLQLEPLFVEVNHPLLAEKAIELIKFVQANRSQIIRSYELQVQRMSIHACEIMKSISGALDSENNLGKHRRRGLLGRC